MSTAVNSQGRRGVGRPTTAGNVRERILAATLRQLEETGSPELVTIASVVAEAGCTPPSLYHYWPTRTQLLAEASRRGWDTFREAQAGAVAGERDPMERVRLRGLAYLEFALAKPPLFRVLFMTPPESYPGAPATGAGSALDDLVADVAAAMTAGRMQAAEPTLVALALWSAIHGVAALAAVSPGLPEDLARSVVRVSQEAILGGLSR